MVFSSITFLYYFLPLVLLVYFIAPRKCRNLVLLLASIIFYAWGESKCLYVGGEPILFGYLFVMLATVLLGYVAALIIEKYRGGVICKLIYIVALFCCIGLLIYFKYIHKILPIGISFYTFQLISYVVDVYRGDVKAGKNPVNVFTYVIMFPQLVAGPIVRYKDIETGLTTRNSSISDIREGIVRFTLGLGKKVLIANQLGELVDIITKTENNSVTFMWVYAVAVTLQLYFDFSGYSDMAIGLGRIIGFKFPENFDYPYMSRSITEFWRRWHMTLGTWFKDYVYIPMGGSRVKSLRLVFNLIVVWSLTGLWHGGTLNFLVWGLMFAIILIVEKLFALKYINKAKVINHIYVMLVVIIGFVIFSTEDMTQAGNYLADMFGFGGLPVITQESLYYICSYGVTIAVALFGATPLFKKIGNAAIKTAEKYKMDTLLETVVLAIILILSTAHIVDGSFNPFLYFRF